MEARQVRAFRILCRPPAGHEAPERRRQPSPSKQIAEVIRVLADVAIHCPASCWAVGVRRREPAEAGDQPAADERFFALLAVALLGGLAAYRRRRPSRRPQSRANSKRVRRRASLPLRAV
jgi:MYXO-CTERM domain-containing protein